MGLHCIHNAATHIHASTLGRNSNWVTVAIINTAQLQLCVLKQSSRNWLCTQKTQQYNVTQVLFAEQMLLSANEQFISTINNRQIGSVKLSV